VADLTLPFEDLPTVWQLLFVTAFVVICLMLVWTTALFVRGSGARHHPPGAPPDDTDAFTWVFLVPALNEEVTIADSVARLQALDLRERHIVVIDDGSDDRTPELLAELAAPGLHVLRRDAPEAREGKAAALNHAWRELGGILPGTDPERVIVGIVDADGRLAPDAPRYATASFADPEVGGVQSLVRIYNRSHPLTWLQDVEFGIYGCLYQAGRTGWGTAGMGGNGQFNRLAALNAIADRHGPWQDRLTEDQDLGLRLIGAGWKGRQELRAVVEQQGLKNLRKLFRQRTRWSQGNLQAMGLIGTVWRAPTGLVRRIEQIAYLLMPFWQTVIGVSLIVAVVLWLSGAATIWEGGPLEELVFFYLLGFGGTLLGCVARGATQGRGGALRGLLIAQGYAYYSWLLWPVLARSAWRQITERRNWVKTEREPLQPTAHS
jgi:cellulose synthase/poly-beta-1,6-N-acetylglucosamine synthase-like glycosyltransferase